MIIARELLLNRLIEAKGHNLIKILVGIRRCGKSFLLFKLFKQHLLDSGVASDHIIEIDLESETFTFCRDAITLGKEIRARLPSDNLPCFVLIDEIQHAEPILPEGTDLSRLRPEDRQNAYINLNQTIYLRDVIERFKLRDDVAIESVTDIAMSNIGCLTNPTRLSAMLNAAGKITTNNVTVARYLGFLESAFLIRNARLFDLRGNRYFDYPSKYYAVDTGIRNSRLNFRQDENTHLMENVIYNELVRRGYSVDVGAVEMFATVNGRRCRKRYEVNFVVNRFDQRFYIQSAWDIPDNEKREQETFSLRHIGDNFRKVVVTGNPYEKPWTDRNGVTFMGIMPFLLDRKSIETL